MALRMALEQLRENEKKLVEAEMNKQLLIQLEEELMLAKMSI